MSRVELEIYYKDGSVTKQRAVVNKWKFLDSMMGEQYIMFNITSETPIAWAIGDYCVFRGETFTLNYVPSVTQKARIKERQDSFTYENVKFESQQEELTRCIMLDITPTTGDYIAALGTNYTGSSRFNLFCGETTANGSTLTAVCALAAKMQANLDRMFPTNGWKILVDTKTTYIDGSGNPVLVTHTDDKMLSFDNTTVAQALAEVHNTFDLDYCVRGRTIYIGYSLKNLTSDNDDETFAFGYGKGYPTRDDSGKALFQIKRIANSQQKVVTRLRALGSTKNMPYRYYNSKYNLSQSLFPTNLQLPNTFIPEGSKSDAAGTNSKWGHNKQRASYLRAVKGDTNDAYIDKNDDAASCVEGIREESARWDGTNGDLPEIYPTIEEATYGELRSALVQDQDGRTGQDSFPNYGSTERIDSMLAIGYLSDGTLVDDANKGDGILPKNGTTGSGIPRSATIGQTTLNYNTRNNGDFTNRGSFYAGVERTLFTIQDVSVGKYAMAPTFGAVIYGFSLSSYKDGISAEVGFQIAIKQKSKNTGTTTTIATYTSDFISIARADGIKEMALPEIPDVKDGSGAKVSSVTVTELSDITVTFTPIMRNITVPSDFTDNFGLVYKVGNSRLDNTVTYAPEYTWISVDDEGNSEETFHVFIKDMGFDITACWTDDTPVVAMKSGRCVGREFEIGENVQKVTYNGKQGYMLTLKRATDSSLNTYYPSANDPIAAGDYFVLLNISMPDVYVKMAEVRLLKAATDYLADNCETAFTYQPYIDDIYLQRNYDNMEAAGTPEKSIFWRLYAGLKFTFRGIPTNEEDPLPLADITIAQVSISMGEGLTPKVEITLNDDVQQSTLQKLTTSVDRIYNGSLFSSGSGGAAGTGANSAALMSILQSEGAKQFLSKKKDDTARGLVGFVKGLWVKTKGLFGFSEQGDVTARSLKTTGSSGGTTPDADNVTQKNLGLEVSESGIIGGILRVAQSLLTKTIQSLNFSGSDSLTGTGWQLTDNDGNGRSRLIVDDAVFRGKVSLNQLEVRKLTAMGGNYVFSPAAGIIEEVDYYGYKIVPGEVEPAVELLGYEYIKVPWVLRLIPLSLRGRYLSRKKWVRSTMTAEDYARVRFYRCWLKADDGSTQTINTWQVGMLARCQTFDTSQIENGNHAGSYDKPQGSGGTYSNVTNKLYWRAVVAKGEGIDKEHYQGETIALDDGRKHNYIDLANYVDNGVQLFFNGSDHVNAGDHIVSFGDWKEEKLANLVTIETIGSDAPAVKEFVGVGYTDGASINWSLDDKVLTRISPISGNKFVAPEFIIETTGEKLGMKPRSSANVLDFYSEQHPVESPQNGDTLLLHYTDYASEDVYKEYDATKGEWNDGKFVLGTTVVNQHDGHIYEVTSTGWCDLGLMDESKSQLHAELMVTADAIRSEVKMVGKGENLLDKGSGGWRKNDTDFPAATEDAPNYRYYDDATNDIFSPVVFLAKGTYCFSAFVPQGRAFDIGTSIVLQQSCSVADPSQGVSVNAKMVGTTSESKAVGNITYIRQYAVFDVSADSLCSINLWGNDASYADVVRPKLEVGEAATAWAVSGTAIEQTADRIDMKVRTELGETGIDIDRKQIRLIGDQVGFYNKTTNTEYIKIGLEDALYNGQTVKMPYFIFMAPDGVTEMYNLGYTGLRQLVNNAVPDKWTAVMLMGAVDYGQETAEVTALQHDTDLMSGDLINPMLIRTPELSSQIGVKGWFDKSESSQGLNVTPMGEKGAWVFEEGHTVNAQGQRIYNIGGNTPSQYDGCYYCDQETSQQGIPLHPVNADTADYGWYFVGGEKIVYIENGVVKATGAVTSETDGYVVRAIDPATGRETITLKNWYRLTMKVNGQTVKGVVNDKGGTVFSGYNQSMIPADDIQHIGQVTIPDFPEEEES